MAETTQKPAATKAGASQPDATKPAASAAPATSADASKAAAPVEQEVKLKAYVIERKNASRGRSSYFTLDNGLPGWTFDKSKAATFEKKSQAAELLVDKERNDKGVVTKPAGMASGEGAVISKLED